MSGNHNQQQHHQPPQHLPIGLPALTWIEAIENEANENEYTYHYDVSTTHPIQYILPDLPECLTEDNKKNREDHSPWLQVMNKWWVEVALAKNSEEIYAIPLLGEIYCVYTFDEVPFIFQTNDFSQGARSILRAHFNSSPCFDVTLCCSDDNIAVHAHKAILAANSDYFTALFKESWWETTLRKESTVCCNGRSYEVRCVLQYFYTGETFQFNTLEVEGLINCLLLAHEFLSTPIVTHIVDMLCERINRENVLAILSLADVYSFDVLLDRSLSEALLLWESEDQNDMFAESSMDLANAVNVLKLSFNEVKSRHGIVFKSIRELLAILKEALVEEFESYTYSAARNDSEIVECSSNIVALESQSSFLRRSHDHEKLEFLRQRLQRLHKVRQSLEKQKLKIDRQKEFFRIQQSALDKIFVKKN